MDASFPLGPWLGPKDEIPDPANLKISLEVNSQVKQESNTNQMIFRVADLIEYVSEGITSKPDDVISTGTPPGVALNTGDSYLQLGDVIECEIEKIGILRNPVHAET